jgi:hypothetical protein
MTLGPDDMDAVLWGARQCDDSTRDAYFAYVSEQLRAIRDPSTRPSSFWRPAMNPELRGRGRQAAGGTYDNR